MSTIRLVIKTENAEIISVLESFETINKTLLSPECIHGNFEISIEKLLKIIDEKTGHDEKNYVDADSDVEYHYNEQDFRVVPNKNGLIFIDLKDKKILNNNVYNNLAKYNLLQYMKGLSVKEKHQLTSFKQTQTLLANNELVITQYFKEKKYTIEEFFGTHDIEKIHTSLSDKTMRQYAPGFIQHLEKIDSYYFEPLNFPMKNVYYNKKPVKDLFIDLHLSGIQFTDDDLRGWYDYLLKIDHAKEIQEIKNYVNQYNETQTLEKAMTLKTSETKTNKIKM
jgi:hypothetical protein